MTTVLGDVELLAFFELIKEGQHGPARIRIRKFLNVHPDNGQAEFLFGLTYHREKDYAQARSWFEQAIDHAPEYVTTYYFLGWCLYYLGELESARSRFETHQKYQPEVGDTSHALGLIALDLGDLALAEQHFRRAIELQQDDPDLRADLARSHIFLAEVLAHREMLEEARTELERAIDIWPDHEEAHYQLYLIRIRLGDTEGAAEAQRAYEETKARVERQRAGAASPPTPSR